MGYLWTQAVRPRSQTALLEGKSFQQLPSSSMPPPLRAYREAGRARPRRPTRVRRLNAVARPSPYQLEDPEIADLSTVPLEPKQLPPTVSGKLYEFTKVPFGAFGRLSEFIEINAPASYSPVPASPVSRLGSEGPFASSNSPTSNPRMYLVTARGPFDDLKASADFMLWQAHKSFERLFKGDFDSSYVKDVMRFVAQCIQQYCILNIGRECGFQQMVEYVHNLSLIPSSTRKMYLPKFNERSPSERLAFIKEEIPLSEIKLQRFLVYFDYMYDKIGRQAEDKLERKLLDNTLSHPSMMKHRFRKLDGGGLLSKTKGVEKGSRSHNRHGSGLETIPEEGAEVGTAY